MALPFATPSAQARLASFLPFLRWAPLVNGRTARADLMAGLTGAIVVLPQGVAFATIAGMPPQYGLYASIAPTIVAALFGSSWQLVAGPSTTASLVLAASLVAFATPGTPHYVELAMTLAIMTGLIELALGLFKLGVIVNFVSHSVVIGYTAGVGALIIATQSAMFFGLDVPSSHDFVIAVWQTFKALPSISLTETTVAVATLGAGVAARKYLPRIPYMLPALLAGALVAAVFNAWRPGAVAVVGALPAQLPPLSAPSFDPHIWRILLPTALAVAISALNEVVSIGRALAVRTEQDLDINQEFVGQGLANIAAPFFSGYVVSGSFNRSALNYESGARTPLAAVSAGLILLGLVVFAAPLAAYLPRSAMAASLVMIGWGLMDRRTIANIWRMSRAERWVFAITIFSALFIHIQMAIFVGVALSLLIFLYRTSVPDLRRRVPDPMSPNRKFTDVRADLPECPQFHVLRLDGSLYFGAVSSFRDSMRRLEAESPACRQIAIVMTGVNFIDLAGAEALALEARKLRARGGGLYLIRLKERASEFLGRGQYADMIGRDHMFTSKTAALREVYRHLDYDICRSCKLSVFVECARLGKQGPQDDDPPPPAATGPRGADAVEQALKSCMNPYI